jgi:hypothetical protein
MDLTEKWKKFVSDMNAKGVPLPTLRDPKTGIGSVSLTLVFVSFNLCVAGIIGKWAGALGGIDIQAAFQLFMASGALYWGRKLQKDDKGGVILETKDKED